MRSVWFETFQHDPSGAVTDLFRGAAKGVATRLDTPEILLQTFRSKSAEDRASLDEALADWLRARRNNIADEIETLGEHAYTKRVTDALIALQLLELRETRERIRASLNEWLRWLHPLRIAPERDPELECWRLMAIGQSDARHESDWLRLAADRRPEYLDVALAGLRALPNDGDARLNQTLLVQAVFRHATSVHDDHHAASRLLERRLAALRAVYPRGPQHWRNVLADVVEANEHDERPVARELRHLLRPIPSARKPGDHGPFARRRLQELERAIEDDAADPQMLTSCFFELIGEYAAHAERTGSSHYFVRSLHDLANRLLDRGYFAASQMHDLRVWIETALAWEPWNAYCWMLLADWYGVVSDADMRESVLREMLRLFPDNEPSRVELARLVIARDSDGREEAERRLREAVALSDDHLYARVELARLLLETDEGRTEAEDLLRHVLERDAENPVASRFLGRLLALRRDDWDQAEDLLSVALRQSPDDLDALVALGRLLTRRHRIADAQALRQAFTERNPYAARALHDRLRFDNDDDPSSIASDTRTNPRADHAWFDWRHTVQNAQVPRVDLILNEWARELLHRGELAAEFVRAERARMLGQPVAVPSIQRAARQCDPLAGFYAQWLAPDDAVTSPPNAWASRACQYWQQSAAAERWSHLERQFPEAAAETSFLQMLCSASPPTTERWRKQFGRQSMEQVRPTVSFIGARIDRVASADQQAREILAFAVLANRALDPPVFASRSPVVQVAAEGRA